jgi:protein phosphatase PTC2/3
MVAEAEVMHQAAVPVLEVQYHRCVAKGVVGMSAAAAAPAEVGVEVEVAVEVPQMVSG